MEFFSYPIESKDFRRAGAASRAIKQHLKRIGADAEAIRRAMIAAYEAEMNVVIHSVGGRLEASVTADEVDVSVIDDGPGIPDIELALTEGYSTATAEARALGFGAGMGLPNIQRSSDRMRVTSRVGEGTRVSFTVNLHKEATFTAEPTSLYALPAKCRKCRFCLTACPTHAMRLRAGYPSVLEDLCIGCASCISSCTSDALTIRTEISSLEDLSAKREMLLAVPPALLAGCGPSYSPAQVAAALGRLGFAGVVTVAPFEEALRNAVLAWAAEPAGVLGPRIVPACPAVVNLIKLRFPSLLPALAPFRSPWEALRDTYAGRGVAFVVSCPAQRSALLSRQPTGDHTSGPGPSEYLLPELVREAALLELSTERKAAGEVAPEAGEVAGGGAAGSEADLVGACPPGAERAGLLRVTGIRGVIAVLEQMEDGLLGDIVVIEPYVCEGGCFGSPLLAEDHHVAQRRWNQGRLALTPGSAVTGSVPAIPATSGEAVAIPLARPYAASPGIRLDADMAKAIEKLGRMQELIRRLPGRDCGTCGAPSCAALAEDIVMERADIGLCPYLGAEEKEPDR